MPSSLRLLNWHGRSVCMVSFELNASPPFWPLVTWASEAPGTCSVK